MDVSGWYATFTSDSRARRAQKVLENRKLQHYAVNLDIRKPPTTLSTPLPLSPPPRSSFDATPKDPVVQAREMILAELKTLLRKDLRERLIRARIVHHIEEVRAKKRTASISPAKAKADTKLVSTDAPLKPIAALKFTKKPGAITKKRPIQEVVEDEVPLQSAPAIEADTLASCATSPTPEVERPVRKTKRAKIVPEEELESEDDKTVQLPTEEQLREERHKRPAEDVIEPPKRGRKKRKVKVEEPTVEAVIDLPTIILTPDVEMPPTVDIPVPDEKFEEEQQPIVVEAKPTKPRGRSKRTPAPKVPMQKPPPPDPFEVGITRPLDDEDLWFLHQGMLGRKESKPRLSEVPMEEESPIKKRHTAIRQHITGSARTEGYYKIPDAVKSLYVASRNRAAVAVDESNKISISKTVGASSRSTRVDSRKLARGMEQANKYLNLSADAQEQSSLKLKFNQLKTRKKQLKFSRSPIHDWGLYAMEPISQGEMVIEYVGELIRQQVADKREKYYERMGIGSSYLFRVDDDAVVDATKKGNLGLVQFLLVFMICC